MEFDALSKQNDEFDLFSSGPVVVFKWKNDNDWTIEFVSDNIERIFGYTQSEFMTNQIRYTEIIHPDDLSRLFSEIKAYNQTSVANYEHPPYRIFHKNGKLSWVKHSSAIIRDHCGRITHAIGYVCEINSFVTAEQDFKQKEDEYRRFFELAVVGMFQSTPSGKFIRVNQKFADILGYTSPQDIINSIGDISKEYYVNSADRLHYITLLNDQRMIENFEFQVRRRDNSVCWVSNSTLAVWDEKGELSHYEGTVIDITDRKRAEEEREKLEIQLRQKHKMETIGLMAGGIAHNFNNNLAIILGNVEISQAKLGFNNPASKYLDNAKIAICRARDLIQQILAYSHQGTSNKDLIRLSDVVEETITLFKSTLSSTINFQYKNNLSKTPDDIVHVDASQVQEILLNLFNNAIHAMKQSGELTLLLDRVELQESDFPASFDGHFGAYMKIAVQDTGSGMTKDILERIFEPFFTTKEGNQGTGMGLSTVQGIVEQHGGFIQVESTHGKGSCFELYFPVVEEKHQAPSSAIKDLRGGTERILFLDDEKNLSTTWSQLIGEYGYRVETFVDSADALEVIKNDPNRFDLLITDQTMPHLSGMELIKEVHSICPDMPTILCTGYHRNNIHKEKMRQLGINAFFLKPVDPPKLLQAIRDILDHHQKIY